MPEYDYHGLVAATWDASRGDTSNWSDRAFYLEVIRRYGEPVLDLGCGTGRLLLDYRATGIDVDGVDNSPEMLDICVAKASAHGQRTTGLYRQRLEELDLPREYRTILGPSSVVQLVTDATAADTAMGRVLRHLQRGGAFVASFSFEWRPGDRLDTGWTLLFEQPRPDDGATVRAWSREWHEPAAQLWHTEQRFEVEVGGEVVHTESHQRSPEGRWYTQQQAVELFRRAGFADVEVYHEFTHEPARADDRLFCVLGTRPGEAADLGT
jgi:SAM-dependent methyltransferase